jgi:hypothetical protein
MRNENKKGAEMKLTKADLKKHYYKNLSGVQEDICERLEIVTFTFKKNGKPGVLVWKGKQAKPLQYYSFPSVEKQMAHVKELIESEVKEMEAKKAKAEKKKAAVCPYKVGDILTGSWGYDQTNVEAYEIVALKGKKTVVLKSVCMEITDTVSGMSCHVKPLKGEYVEGAKEIVKMAMTHDGEKWYVKLHYSCYLSLWDGSKMYKSWYA